MAGVAAGPLAGLLRSGPDLADLLDRVETLMADAGASDRASLFATATKALAPHPLPLAPFSSMPVLLLDVPFESDAEAHFLWTLVKGSPKALVTVPDGDMRTIAQLEKRGVELQRREPDGDTDLTRLSRHLFSAEPPPERERSGELIWFSAPGEGRECVEIARRILKEAANGIRFDEIAILIRSPQHYVGVLEHALARAKIPAYFDRGIRRPHPAGRAFLAMLSCAVESLSAKRFAEYLSLGQVPQPRSRVERYLGGVERRGFRRAFRESAQTADQRVQDDNPLEIPTSPKPRRVGPNAQSGVAAPSGRLGNGKASWSNPPSSAAANAGRGAWMVWPSSTAFRSAS